MAIPMRVFLLFDLIGSLFLFQLLVELFSDMLPHQTIHFVRVFYQYPTKGFVLGKRDER